MPRWLIWTLIIMFGLASVASPSGGSPAQAQGPWPPVDIQVKPVLTGNRVTFEIKVTSLVDWDLADFVLKVEVPSDTAFVEGHADFDGASVTFDGREVTFAVVKLPLRATLGYRFTVELAADTTQIYLPEMWVSWKGRLPGQYLFASDHRPLDLASTPTLEAPGVDDLSHALAGGLPVIHLWGSAYEQGLARGHILRQSIIEQVQAELAFILPQAHGGSATKWLEAIHTQVTQIAPGVLDELRGMAEGSGVSLDDLELINFAVYVAPPETPLNSGSGCYVLAATGNTAQARNLIIGRRQELSRPASRPAFLVRHPQNPALSRVELALPASLEPLAVVTAGGLFVESHRVLSQGAVPAGATDSMSLIRDALDAPQTLESLQQALLSQNRMQAANMTIARLPKKEVRALELSYTQSAVLLPDADGLLISADRYLSPEMQALQPQLVAQSPPYYNRLLELARASRGQITSQAMQTFLHDPQIWDGTGLTVVIDADLMTLAYWEQFHQEWFTLSLRDLLEGAPPA